MNCHTVKEGLLDFLYEELPADSREAFEEHLRGCSSCRAEVASYRTALGSARSALSGTLSQDPPARVHHAVVEAAKAATQAKSVPRMPAREAGFFAKLWRTPWLLPAFGAASVATAVFLVRVLKNPEVIPGQRAQPIGEMTEPVPARAVPLPAPEQAAAAPTKATARPEKGEATSAEEPRGDTLGEKNKPRRSPGESTRPREATGKGSAGQLVGSPHLDQDNGAGFAPHKARAPSGARKDIVGLGDSHLVEGGSAPQGGPAAPSRFAVPPQPRLAAPASAGAADEHRPRSKDLVAPGASVHIVDELAKELPGNGQATAFKRAVAPAVEPRPNAAPRPAMQPAPMPAAPPEAPVASAAAGKRSLERRAEAEASGAPTAPMREEAGGHDKAQAQHVPSFADSVRRADRLFTEQDWTAAADAYRDLLRRYPGHADAGKWRSRIDHAVFAAREADQAGKKPAKAKAAADAFQENKP